MLKLTNVKKQYQNIAVIDIPLLQLNSGMYWLTGANGSGKTTLLKMIAALLPFEGDIAINNISLKKQPLLYRQQASWADAEPLYPSFMTGKDIIALYCNVRKVEMKEVMRLSELFGMAAYLNDAIGTYSAGMTKKLSLMLALLGNPSLVMLDEPLITLDAASISVVIQHMLDMHRTAGCSFLMSSHQDLQDAIAVAGSLLTIQNGTVITHEPAF